MLRRRCAQVRASTFRHLGRLLTSPQSRGRNTSIRDVLPFSLLKMSPNPVSTFKILSLLLTPYWYLSLLCLNVCWWRYIIVFQNTATRGHSFTVACYTTITMETKRNSFAIRVVKPWNSLPEEVYVSNGGLRLLYTDIFGCACVL